MMPHFAFPVQIVNKKPEPIHPVGAMIIVGSGNNFYTFHNFNTDKNLNEVFKDNQSITGDEFPEGVDFGGVENGEGAFYGCTNLKGFNEGVSFKSLKNAKEMFTSCTNLKSLPKNLDLGKLSDGSYMFLNCTKLTELPESTNLSSLTNGTRMFEDCTNLKHLPENLDLGNLYNGQGMFQNCTKLRVIPKSINLKNLQLGVSMFSDCYLNAESVKNILKSLPTTSTTHNINVGYTHNDSTTDPVDWRNDEEIAEMLNTSIPIDYDAHKFFDMDNGWRVYIEN